MKTIQKFKVYALSLLFLLMMGCEGLLDVNNPNNVLEEDLSNPKSAANIANGALFTVAQGIGYVLAPYEAATDEVRWIGSRDAWGQLDQGKISDFNNEFTDAAWPFISEGRWMADRAVILLEGFDATGSLTNRLDLARAYLYAALVRVAIGDMFDDFVYSDKTVAGTPIGETNMSSVYDQATALLAKAKTIAESGTTATHQETRRRVMGLTARARHAKDIWSKVNPKGTVPSAPYAGSAQTVADAQAALALMTGDYKWNLDYFSALTFNEMAWEAVGRSELACLGKGSALPGNPIDPIPNDPVSGTADVRITNIINDFTSVPKYQDRYSPLTMTSAREMHLIIAEGALAAGNALGCITSLNTVRAMDNLAPYLVTDDAGTALKHERRANLYLQGRRLADMYRFGVQDTRWLPGSEARTTAGVFLPITIQERRSNPNVQ
ncbi:MAG TPA: hypothetical protein VII11_00995 [Bacteroidota bacterium]